MDGVILSLGVVKLFEFLAQAVGLDPRNCVFSGVEGGLGPAKDLGCNVVLVKLVDLALKILFAQVAQQTRQAWRP